MKKNIFIVFLIAVVIGLFFYNRSLDETIKNSSAIDITELNNKTLNYDKLNKKIDIFIYDKDDNKLKEKVLDIKKDGDLEPVDYISKIMDNTDFIDKSNMRVLAIYELNDHNRKNLIVKVNSQFNRLDKETELIGFSKSLSQTILNHFKDFDLVYLQIDTN